ncbi:hypothetical protein [Halococcus thailandensis]|uniref:hypothetical protein n=1 Tax=Halococcus thailandensis TaxID=335952 RepID=UPI0012694251|nr:hypothetical protein [Halococcus thailandensis]
MSTAAVRRFDLYDFFSVLLPGLALILGLYPFYPQGLTISSLGAVLPLLAGGFAVGRVVHSAAVRIEDWIGSKGHRDLFATEIRHSPTLDRATVEAFYECCRSQFDIELTKDRTDLTDDAALGLYSVVRSHVYIDSRGRSQTFQAISAFYRSMWFVSVFLAVLVFLYGAFPAIQSAMPYPTKIATLSVPPQWFTYGAIILFAGSYTTFREAKATHRELFVQYLITDFISLSSP